MKDTLETGLKNFIANNVQKKSAIQDNSTNKKHLTIHIFTDSTGETTINICNVAMSQFAEYKGEIFVWPFLKSTADIDVALESVFINPGIIIYSIMPKDLIYHLHNSIIGRKDVMVVPALLGVITGFASYLGVNTPSIVGRAQTQDKEYIQKMGAMEYTMNHDDGTNPEDMEQADIIVIGVSRTAKTPTSLYLAHRGFKVMNIPYVSEDTMPKDLFGLKNAIVVGLLIDPIRLFDVRQSRSLSLPEDAFYTSEYTSMQHIEQELSNCRHLFSRLSCPVIDITNRSVEEIATQIIKIYNFVKSARSKKEHTLKI